MSKDRFTPAIAEAIRTATTARDVAGSTRVFDLVDEAVGKLRAAEQVAEREAGSDGGEGR